MSDHLTEGWPLGPTSTIYMNGRSVYDVRRYGKPGIIASLEMLPGQAERIRAAIDERIEQARAEGWDACAGWHSRPNLNDNPYRKEAGHE